MAIERRQLVLAPLVALCLAGCATTAGGTLTQHDNWGEANRQTMAAQIIDPAPVYETAMTTSGDQVAAAIERYRTGQVKQPERIKTSKTATTGGSN